MKEKLCPKCSTIKPSSEFWVRRRKTKTGTVKEYLQQLCKNCSTTRRVARYQANRGRENSLRRIWEDKNRGWLQEFKKTLKCANCDESRWYVLDFHHTDPSSKDFDLASSFKFSKDRILEEIAKCEVLCANCHREKHYLERLATGTVRYGRLPVTQDIQTGPIPVVVAK